MGADICWRKFNALLDDGARVLLFAQFVDVALQELEYRQANTGRPPTDDLCDCVVAEGVTDNLVGVLIDPLHDAPLLLGVSRTRNDDLDDTEAVSVLTQVRDPIPNLLIDEVEHTSESFGCLFRLVD